ncbi:MAG TPA: cytochrome c biogenesis protein CcsA, partial [Acidimicrobiia bacterium]|nr:cytochrome c biogenesis protein CcsA [Acidimicrobiia bacterium]
MKGAIGFGGITLGFMAAALGVATMAIGIRRRDRRIMGTGRQFVFMVLAGAVVAAGAMEWALVTHDFSLAYVVNNHARSTPLLYTVAALWGALEGSILLWAVVLGGYLAVTVHRLRARASEPLVAWATLVGLVVAAFFFALMLGPANPFAATEGLVPSDGRGPNPLLQNHVLMAIHPPMLYLGYVGMTIPFSFAVAALITGRVGEGWLLETRRATLVAWAFLTTGIILGAWWSYEVLGWGGYWAWDPVENASFIPWLTATAFLHSVVVQERRGMLRVWNLSLVIATFCLTILGTFLTRSGVLNSVHAFSESDIGAWFLAFLGLAAATGIGLIAWRGDRLRTPGRIDSPVSREGAFLANNLMFGGFAFVVLL